MFDIDDAQDETPPKLPKYSDKGRILVRVEEADKESVYDFYYEVLAYDEESSVFWIIEGEGFDDWLDTWCDFPGLGTYVIEGIAGTYKKGDLMYGEDDNIDWQHDSIRLATEDEIRTGALT